MRGSSQDFTIPGPDRRTSLAALRALLRERSMLAALRVFHARLGDAFRVPLPGFSVVMLAGPEACRYVLATGREAFRWRPEGDPVTRLLRRGVLVVDGEEHDEYRRLMSPALHKKLIGQYVAAMWRWTDAVTQGWPEGEPVDMLVEMRRIALLILMDALFGVDFSAELDLLWDAILGLLRYISPGPWLLWRGAPRRNYEPAIQQIDAYLYRLIAERRAHPAGADDLLGLLIASGMGDDRIRDQLLTMFIAGHDTSTVLLSWALYLLATHPDALQKAVHEVDAVLGRDEPGLEHIGQLRYLEQVINESLRLYPPIHLGSRVAARDVTVLGHRIPAGTRVVYSIYLTHRHPRYWPDPDRFDPERFAPENARQRPPYTFLPFGGGPRNCIGMPFAQVESQIVLARILQRYTLEFAGQKARPVMGASLVPGPGVWIRVRRR